MIFLYDENLISLLLKYSDLKGKKKGQIKIKFMISRTKFILFLLFDNSIIIYNLNKYIMNPNFHSQKKKKKKIFFFFSNLNY